MAWVPAVILGALGLYAVLKDNDPRCPNCKSFVAKNSNRCRRCGAPLGWN